MKLFKFFITTVVVISTLSSMMLDAAKSKQKHDFKPSKKARIEGPKPAKEKDYERLGEMYALAVEHEKLDQRIVDTLKDSFLDALKDKKKVYQAHLVKTSLIYAAGKGLLPVIQKLIQESIQSPSLQALVFTQNIGWVFIEAAKNGHLPITQELIQNPLTNKLLSVKSLGTALEKAAANGHLPLVQEMLRNPLIKDRLFDKRVGSTSPIHFGSALKSAAKNEYLPVVEEFIPLINDPATSSLFQNQALKNAIQSTKIQDIRDAIQKALDQQEVR